MDRIITNSYSAREGTADLEARIEDRGAAGLVWHVWVAIGVLLRILPEG